MPTTSSSAARTTSVASTSVRRHPSAYQAFIEREDTPGESQNLFAAVDPSTQEGDRRYRQNLLQTGDPVYVHGAVRNGEDAVETSYIIGPGTRSVDTEMFMISDVSPARLLERRRWALSWRLLLGALFVAAGVGGLWLLLVPV